MTPFTEMDIDDGQTTVDEDRIGEVICTGSKSAKIVSNAQDENIADDPSALSGSEIQTININEHNFTIEPVGVALTSPTTESMLLEFQLWCKVKRDQPVLRETNIEPNKILESVPSNGVASNVEKLGQQSDTVASFSLPVPEPEMLLSVPASVPDAQNDLLAQFTPEKEVSEEGGNGLKNPSGQKRQLMESALVQRPTPPPTEIASRKQPRITPRASVVKRKVLLDDTMVLHGDTIRQQLTSTEDIRRLRKKAPCTRPEIWLIQKHLLEDELFNEPLFTSMSVDLIGLQNRIFDVTESREVPGEVMWSSATSLIGEANTEGPDEPVAAGGGEANESTATIVLVDSQLCEEHLSDHIDSGVMEKSNGVQTVLPNDGNLDTQFVEKDAFIMQRCNYRDDAVNGSEVNKEGLHLDKGVPMENDRSAQEISESCSVKVMLQDLPQEVDACNSSAFMCIEDPQRDFSCQSEFKITTETVPFDEFENQGSQEADLAGNSSWLSADLGGIMAAETTSLYNASLETPCDLGNTLDGNDTGFLNFNDEDTVEEDNGIPNAEEVGILDNSGWSSRTRNDFILGGSEC
ncbi:hypothetical protein IFM89_004871 [Coptis chinensis]|uniref:Uncharacterized protein n=1 Tax=Coptis chinensis TaxID=261450 RepID=A0A835IAY8_9MAGN|nr:hypothetical protein IFM89_004871 [Coptis chinensis]